MGKSLFGRTAALAALATAAGAASAYAQTASPPPPPPTVTTSWSGAPRTNEEDRQFKVNGRLQYDIYDVSSEFPGTANDQSYLRSSVRRAFIGVEGRFTQHWRYNVKFDLNPSDPNVTPTTLNFCRDNTTNVLTQVATCPAGTTAVPVVGSVANAGTNEVKLDDAYLEYAADDFSIFIGQNNQVSPMEDRDSSNYIPFNERSAIISAAGFGKIFGVDYLMNGGNWSLGVGLHGDSVNNQDGTNVDEASFVIARATYAPIYSRTPDGITLVHLGISARERDNGGDGNFTYSARPEVGFGTSFIGTNASGVSNGAFEHDRWLGGEFAFQHNAFGAEAEYGQIEGQLPGAGSRKFSGGYFDIFWSPTGESRNYSAADGSFGRTAIRRTLGSDGGIGHIMLAARYDTIDLNDGTTDGGKQTTVTGGVTWMPISYVKFQLNYSHNDIERPNSLEDGSADVATFRTQIDW